MFDYKLISYKADGTPVKKFGYQRLLHTLGMQDEIVKMQPLSAGGVPQVQVFIDLLMSAKPAGVDYIVAEYDGQAILSTKRG